MQFARSVSIRWSCICRCTTKSNSSVHFDIQCHSIRLEPPESWPILISLAYTNTINLNLLSRGANLLFSLIPVHLKRRHVEAGCKSLNESGHVRNRPDSRIAAHKCVPIPVGRLWLFNATNPMHCAPSQLQLYTHLEALVKVFNVCTTTNIFLTWPLLVSFLRHCAPSIDCSRLSRIIVLQD